MADSVTLKKEKERVRFTYFPFKQKSSRKNYLSKGVLKKIACDFLVVKKIGPT